MSRSGRKRGQGKGANIVMSGGKSFTNLLYDVTYKPQLNSVHPHLESCV